MFSKQLKRWQYGDGDADDDDDDDDDGDDIIT